MAQLKVVDRSATFSFCQNAPFLAAGSVAGAIDLSFSTSSQLEIFSLDFAKGDRDLKLAGGAVQAPERFARLAWGAPGADRATFPYGLLAGGLADGSVCIWNPARIIGQPPSTPTADNRAGQLLCRLQKHQGGVRGLEFNPFSPNLLASGAADGELCIWDVGNPAQPSLYPAMKGAAPGSQGSDITCLAWNRKVQHILATATVGGTVVVWDLKKQRPVISFKDPAGRRRCSAVAWNPEVATQLVVASDDDASPALQLWDLRNSVSPLMEMHGHSKGVLALSWCPQDASFLLSSGKDNKVIAWDMTTGQEHSELPAASNWKFDVQWAPGKAAGVFAGATFEGKISLHSMASCHPPTPDPATGYQVPHSSKPPAWMKRPAGATFGFGGKLLKFSNSKRQLPTGEVADVATIETKQISVASSTFQISPEFEQVIRSADKEMLRLLCESRAAAASSPQEAETWSFLQTHFEGDGRHHLLLKLGFENALPKPDTTTTTDQEEIVDGGGEVVDSLAALSLEQQAHAAATHPSAAQILSGGGQQQHVSATTGDGSAFFSQPSIDGGGAFFDNLSTPRENTTTAAAAGGGGFSPSHASASLGKFNSTGAAAAAAAAAGDQKKEGTAAAAAAPAVRPIIDGPPGEAEEEIQSALLVGNYQGAVEVCLRVNRHADALITASLVGGETWEEARKQYMMSHPRPFMHVMHAVLSGDWNGFVSGRSPSAWRQTLAALLTSAPYDQFEHLVATLAARVAAAGIHHAATLCYICSGDVEAAVRMWTRAATAAGSSSGSSSSGGGARSGNGIFEASPAAKEAVMEKAVVLGLGVDKAGASTALGDLLARHAEALAATGKLSAAYDLLTLVPIGGESSSGGAAAVLRDRLYRSGAIPQAAMAPPPFPFTTENITSSSSSAGGGGVSVGVGAATSTGYGYGQQPQQYSQQASSYGAAAAASLMKPPTPTYAGAGGYGAPSQQPQQQMQQNGYGNVYQQQQQQLQQQQQQASAPPPPPPSVYKPYQPPTPSGVHTTYGTHPPPPPSAAAPPLHHPPPPPPAAASVPPPPPPTVYQPQHSAPPPPPPSGNLGYGTQAPPQQQQVQHQYQPYGGGGGTAPSPRSLMSHPSGVPPPPPQAPPTVYQPSMQNTAPPMGAMMMMGGGGAAAAPPPSMMHQPPPPPLTIPQTPSSGAAMTMYQPSPAVPGVAPPQQHQQRQGQQTPAPPPPTVYQHSSITPAPPQQHQQQQQPSFYGMSGGMSGGGALPTPVAAPVAAPPPPPPPGPPADISIATVDTSAVAGELRPVINTITALYQACEGVFGAHPARRRELDDSSKKLGALFWRLNEGDVSPGVSAKLQQLCAALDGGDYATAGHVQVQLTSGDWEECSSWLTALKRLIKMRQS